MLGQDPQAGRFEALRGEPTDQGAEQPAPDAAPLDRVERTSAAMNVLSGSSTTKIAAKVKAMTLRLTDPTY